MEKKTFKAESQRLLDLMINSIYTHKEIFLREIISNASDAIDKMHFVSLTDEKAREAMADTPSINIYSDKDARTITVTDDGIGMSEQELEDNLGTIAKSGSLQFKKELDENEKSDIIGQFGVGFYSAFMVADDVTVITRRYDSDQGYKWNSNGVDGYTIEPCQKDKVGTQITMHLKEDDEDEKYSEYLDEYRIKYLIKKYSDYIRHPIIMDVTTPVNTAAEGEDPKWESVTNRETVNSMVPIWQRSKSEVSDEECAAYYKENFGSYNDPLATIRVSAEGVVSYKAMLFIPSDVPFNYYTREYKRGLQLYSNGVLIMDKCEQLLPEYYGFVKGVVDSPDLSLNISREILQHDRQLSIIAKNIEKKIKNELKKILDNDIEKYEGFWKNFGRHVKYGVVSDYGVHKDDISDLLVYYSSNEEDKLTTLDSYVSRMPESQKYIYYACGDSIAKITAMPQMELCRDKGYEILYFTQDVDEFVAQALVSYKDKQFKSITAENADLQSDEEKQKTEKKQEDNKELLDFIKGSLNGKIVKAVISNKLKSHPVCLSTEGPVTFEVEKYYAQLPGNEEKPKSSKVLELNPENSAFTSLKSAFEADDKDKAAKYAEILFNQALLIAGLPLEDATHYCDLVCSLM
ncbi:MULTISPECIES: molecular chaperone HtpG [unclassified Ruminococcus]|uniref:molecular chaperone HtpG n=1 Tax=unclassified Ruminococcus TaxID=2608920 RepID=UPI00210CC3F0|nr:MULTISPECIES: molecular chaperone HtpG [unclassified Ruminococcus]MCQ4021861.1 molecular chaperone HtpG [Ruminococcus sp. zg-924]MCQ4114306.1 molecular chaperone HtpG [Ruminococcus sp. zg-921]